MRARPPRGFTLVELLVALAVTAVVMVGVVAVVNAQRRAFAEGNRERAAQTSGRAALALLEQKVSLAGYGLDAPLALDLDRYVNGPCPAQLAPCSRDRIDDSDELVIHARNPDYWVPGTYTSEPSGNAWRIHQVTANDVTVRARQGQRFARGQILQAVCRAGQDWALFTVASTTPVVADPAGEVVTIRLVAANAAEPFRRQDYAAGVACFNGGAVNGEARLFLVDRYRFHVRPEPGTSARFNPYLMLDMGVDQDGDDDVDADDELVVAEGVELLQVAYVFLDNAMAVRGLTPGTQIGIARNATPASGAAAQTGSGITSLTFPGPVGANEPVYRPTSWMRYNVGPPPNAARRTDHQANVRAVRVALSVRSPDAIPGPVGGRARTPLFNMSALPAWIEAAVPFERFTTETTIPLRNMLVRAMNDY
jgi:type IV pilus assembly protein PilW